MNMEERCNDAEREEPKESGKNPAPGAILPSANPTELIWALSQVTALRSSD
jgi:hypothetical protein